MSTYFILLKLNSKNNSKLRTVPKYWSKVLKKLVKGKAKILYYCADTSADVFIKSHSHELFCFTTYVLLTVNLIRFDESALHEAIALQLTDNCTKNIIYSTDMYEVITTEII